MNTTSPRPSTSPPPPTFIGLVLALSGWALIEAPLVLLHAGLPAHLIPTMMALYLISASTRRLKLPQQQLDEKAGPAKAQHSSSTTKQVGWAICLVAVGALTGTLVQGNISIPLGLAILVLNFMPWSRISFCRDHIILASVLMCVGMGLPFLMSHRPISPITLLVSRWLFWLCATLDILRRLGRLWQAERILKATTRASSTQSA
jgi:hypothetical protein